MTILFKVIHIDVIQIEESTFYIFVSLLRLSLRFHRNIINKFMRNQNEQLKSVLYKVHHGDNLGKMLS